MDFLERFLQLLPVGKFWRKERGSWLYEVAEAITPEFDRAESEIKFTLTEIDPRTSFSTLDEWEEMLGITDDKCIEGEDRTLEERRALAYQRYTTRGGNTREYFQNIAIQLGLEGVVVNNFEAFRMGSRMGDRFNTPDQWRGVFEVNASQIYSKRFRMGSLMGEVLRKFGNPVLECTFNRLKPAHMKIFFTYGDT
jgi:uncharacterized protein YmfQ (DUF2313 family)